MALFQRSYNKILHCKPIHAYSKRSMETNIKKTVYISQSTDIYTNLALEEWIYKNLNLKHHHLLLLWQNDPCVVIGRHQNPWSETNISDLPNLVENGVNLARRSSNGTALYHDNGCLNLSFFCPREQLNARYNNEVVARSIFREFGTQVNTNSDGELNVRQNKQISNNSERHGRENSYHYMSLMVRSNKVNRNVALEKHDFLVDTKVTLPISTAKMMNLSEENPQVTVPTLKKAIGWEFLRTKALSLKDGGMELAQQQKGFHMVNPTENWFPGLNAIRDNFKSWEWCFGETPNFNITRSFTVPVDLLHSTTVGSSGSLNVTMTVEKGIIADITIYVPYEFNSAGFAGEAKVIHSLKGKRFSVQTFDDLNSLLDEKDRFLTQCVRQVMTSA